MKRRFHRRMMMSLASGPLAEPIMGLCMLTVGISLAMPSETFAFSNFATLNAIATEAQWAAVFIAVGISQIMLSMFSACLSCRAMMSAMSGSLWVVWTAATLHGGSRGVLWAFGTALAIGHALAFLRAMADRR